MLVGSPQRSRQEEVTMMAQVGDRLVVEGVHVGDARRVGVITAVRHPDGTPPYEVRWLDSGHEALVFPGPEAHVEPADPTASN
jgi:Domain of unknown function (DUF1918)